MRGWTKGAIGACTIFVVLGCEGPEPPADVPQTVVPGVVTSDAPASLSWAVGSEPVLELGEATEGDEALLFATIVDVLVTSDGRIWVANQQDGTIRVFEEDGRHAFTVGRNGDGPFEFQGLHGIAEVEEGVLAWQHSLARPASLWTLDGERVRSEVPDGIEGAGNPGVAGVLTREGRPWLAVTHFPQGQGGGDGAFTESGAVYWVPFERDAGSARVELGTIPMATFFRHREGGQVTFQEYAATRFTLACGTALFTGWSDGWSIERWTPEGVRDLEIRRAHDPDAVTEADREAYVDRMLTLPPGVVPPPGAWERRERMVRGMEFPEFHRTWRRFMCGPDRELWVERDDRAVERRPMLPQIPYAPTTWDIFDAEGRWAATVELPARFHPTRALPDRVLGIRASDLDVEYVVAYPLRRIPAGSDSG